MSSYSQPFRSQIDGFSPLFGRLVDFFSSFVVVLWPLYQPVVAVLSLLAHPVILLIGTSEANSEILFKAFLVAAVLLVLQCAAYAYPLFVLSQVWLRIYGEWWTSVTGRLSRRKQVPPLCSFSSVLVANESVPTAS